MKFWRATNGSRSFLSCSEIDSEPVSQILFAQTGAIGYSVCVGRDRYPNAGELPPTSALPEQSSPSTEDSLTAEKKSRPEIERHNSLQRPGLVRAGYCSVTSTLITPFPSSNGSSAFPTTAPSILLRSVPFIA